MGFNTRAISIACSEADNPKLEFHFLKSSLTSYSPSTLFLTFWSIWGFWKWSQMILHNSKHGFWHQNHVSSMLRSWVTPQVRISLFDVLLDLLQPIHPILGLQVDLRFLKMVPYNSFITQNMGFDTRAISIACSEADNPKLEFHLLKSSLTSYGPSTLFLTFWSIWGSWKLSQMIPHHPEHVFWHQNHVFSMFRSWITPQVKLSLLEVILDPLQPLHPILDCQVDLRLLKMVPNDSQSPKTWGLTPEPCL